MSEYPIGLNREMVHCLDDSEDTEFCRNKLERETNKRVRENNKLARELGYPRGVKQMQEEGALKWN